jgi:hypothetical protein
MLPLHGLNRRCLGPRRSRVGLKQKCKFTASILRPNLMPTPVYDLVAHALTGAVSARAADTLLRAALRDAQVSPDSVGPAQMQDVLRGPLLGRLEGVLSPQQASRELQQVARRISSTFPPEPVLYQDPAGPLHWAGVGDVPARAPVATAGAAVPAEPAGSPAGAAQRPPLGRTDLPPQEALGEDDFEFDDPDYSAFEGDRRRYPLNTLGEQDALLADLARQAGVQGVVLCNLAGQVLRGRAPRGSADKLGAIVAATVLVLQQRQLNILCADLGSIKVCIRPLGHCCVAVLAGEGANVGRLMTGLGQIEIAA